MPRATCKKQKFLALYQIFYKNMLTGRSNV